MHRKVMDVLTPLLLGSSHKAKQHGQPQPASPPPSSDGSKMHTLSRCISHNSGLVEHVNNMKLSEAKQPAQGPATPNTPLSPHHSPTNSVSSSLSSYSAHTPATMPSAPVPAPATLPHQHHHTPHHTQPPALSIPNAAARDLSPPSTPTSTHSLEKLMHLARNCQLPPSPRAEDLPMSPSGGHQTVQLALSPALPPRMHRVNWCLDDYTIGEKLYTGESRSTLTWEVDLFQLHASLDPQPPELSQTPE